MPNINSRQKWEADTPGSAIKTRHLGTAVIGTAALRLKLDSGTFRFTRNAGTVRYISFGVTFQANPVLSVNIGTHNFPAGTTFNVVAKVADTGSFRTGLFAYKRGTVIGKWGAVGI